MAGDLSEYLSEYLGNEIQDYEAHRAVMEVVNQLLERAEQAERERDDLWNVGQSQADIIATLCGELGAAEQRADQAERFGESTQDYLRARVATLEAAGRKLLDVLNNPRLELQP